MLQTEVLQPHGVPRKVAGQLDELIILRLWKSDPMFGAVAGVEVKKALTATALRQAKAKYLLFGCKSQYPFMQVGA